MLLNDTMKQLLLLIFVFVMGLGCTSTKLSGEVGVPSYQPESKELHEAIVRMDSLLFDAYNHCRLDVFAAMVSEDIEFYHDRGGLSTSKGDVIGGVKNNVCGKVTRILLPGSIEVYPIPNFGAVQMGAHRFYNNQEPNAPSRFSKFVHIWKNENGLWKLSRVISLH